MPLRNTLLILATLFVVGPSAAMAQGFDNDGKLAAGASGSGAGLISGGGKVYSNLEAIENSVRPQEAVPETRKVAKKYTSADTGESRRTKAKKKQKIATREARYSRETRYNREARYSRDVRYMRRSGFTAFVVPDYPRY